MNRESKDNKENVVRGKQKLLTEKRYRNMEDSRRVNTTARSLFKAKPYYMVTGR